MTTLTGRTLLMSGGSRGIGLAIATRAAQDSANIVLLAKTAQPHARLQGTVHTAAAQIDAAGGRALAIVGDVRNDDDVARAVAAAVDRFGGLDIVVNNASALDLRSTREIDMKRYELMQEVLAQEGVTDLGRYRAVPGGGPLETDLFLDPLETPA